MKKEKDVASSLRQSSKKSTNTHNKKTKKNKVNKKSSIQSASVPPLKSETQDKKNKSSLKISSHTVEKNKVLSSPISSSMPHSIETKGSSHLSLNFTPKILLQTLTKDAYEKFKNLQEELMLKIKVFNSGDSDQFNKLCEIIKDTLYILDLDIYVPALIKQPNNPLEKVHQLTEKFFEEYVPTATQIAKIISLISENNIKLYYDYGWIYKEKHTLFKPVIEKLINQFHQMVKHSLSSFGNLSPKGKGEANNNCSTSIDTSHITSLKNLNTEVCSPMEKGAETILKCNNISVEAIAAMMLATSVWKFKPSADFVEALVQQMENLIHQKALITTELAFQFLHGVTRFAPSDIVENRPARREFFALLIEKALPLLLEDDPPFKMFPYSKNLTSGRLWQLHKWLPQPRYLEYRLLYAATLTRLHSEKETISGEEIDNALPDFVVPHKKLRMALERKMEFIVSTPDSFYKQNNRNNRKNNKTYFSLDVYMKYIKLLREENNPKGLQWLLTQYSKSILTTLDPKFSLTTYYLEDIKDYLKNLRRCVWDLTNTHVKNAIVRLSEEALSSTHIATIDGDLALDLLWINLVFSTMLPSDKLAYSNSQQEALFTKIQPLTIDRSQAHALFEIKACGWHGNSPFSSKLSAQMLSHLTMFADESSPSAEEKFYYAEINNSLTSHHQKFLHSGYICPETGHEIDIAYIGERKIAIHVDGPFHFDPVTQQPTLKTLFRNHCLQQAGWKSLTIHITDFKLHHDKFEQLKVQLNQLIDEKYEQKNTFHNKKQAEITLSPQSNSNNNNNNVEKNKQISYNLNKAQDTFSTQKCSLSPKTQRVFSALGQKIFSKKDLKKFESYVKEMSDVNRRNQSEIGDTALMTLLRSNTLSQEEQIPKITILLKHGALWHAPNNKGQTAENVAVKHDQKLIAKLKEIKPK